MARRRMNFDEEYRILIALRESIDRMDSPEEYRFLKALCEGIDAPEYRAATSAELTTEEINAARNTIDEIIDALGQAENLPVGHPNMGRVLETVNTRLVMLNNVIARTDAGLQLFTQALQKALKRRFPKYYYDVARKVLGEKLKAAVDPVPTQKSVKHWGRLTLLAYKLALQLGIDPPIKKLHVYPVYEIRDWQRFLYGGYEAKDNWKTIIMIGHIDISYKLGEMPRAHPKLLPYLMKHLEAEDSLWGDKVTRLKDAMVAYEDACYNLGRKLFKEATARIGMPLANKMFDSSFLSYAWDKVLGDIWYNGFSKNPINIIRNAGSCDIAERGVKSADPTHIENMKKITEVRLGLYAEFRQWAEYQRVIDAYGQAAEALSPVKDFLEGVSLRGAFQSKCDMCP